MYYLLIFSILFCFSRLLSHISLPSSCLCFYPFSLIYSPSPFIPSPFPLISHILFKPSCSFLSLLAFLSYISLSTHIFSSSGLYWIFSFLKFAIHFCKTRRDYNSMGISNISTDKKHHVLFTNWLLHNVSKYVQMCGRLVAQYNMLFTQFKDSEIGDKVDLMRNLLQSICKKASVLNKMNWLRSDQWKPKAAKINHISGSWVYPTMESFINHKGFC